jgi:ABC-type phosphate/phosphonate transport system substrate-binding protein
LTGHPPFRADTPLETLRQVTDELPKHPSSLNAAVDRDLATICLKCLEKDPQRRYSSAQALADDLARWLRNEPIEARPVGSLGRIWRWCRREPALAGTLAGVVALLAASTVLALSLYQHKKEQYIGVIEARERERKALLNRIEEAGRKDPSVRVSAQEVAVLGDRTVAIDGTEITVVLGAPAPHPDINPLRMVQSFSPLVNCLQTNLPPADGARVLFELQVYGAYSNALEGVRRHEVDLMRMDPASYVLLRKADPTLTPLVQEAFGGRPELCGVIFARPGAGITRLADLRGKSIAFGNAYSAIGNYAAKAALLAVGLCAADLRSTNLFSGRGMTAVREGEWDAGVVRLDEFAAMTNAGIRLQLVAQLRSPGYTWVATRKLEAAVAKAIRDQLLPLRDESALTGVDHGLTGFCPVTPAEFDTLEQQIEQARRFDEARR